MTNEVLKEVKTLVKGNWWKFFGVYLLTMVIAGFGGGILGGLLSFVINNDIVGMIISMTLGCILGSIFGYGLAKYFFDARNKEEKLVTIFYGFTNFVGYLKFLVSSLLFFAVVYAASLIAGLIMTAIGFIPVAGPIVSILLFAAYMVVVVMVSLLYTFYIYRNYEGDGIIGSLKESRKLVSGHKWFVFWTPLKLALVPVIILIVGYALVIPGMFTTLAAVMNGSSFTQVAGSGVMVLGGFLLIIVSLIWMLILIPKICMVCPVMYDKLKAMKKEEIAE